MISVKNNHRRGIGNTLPPRAGFLSAGFFFLFALAAPVKDAKPQDTGKVPGRKYVGKVSKADFDNDLVSLRP